MAAPAPSPETGRAAFQAATGVSRETLARLDAYAACLGKWNRRINLVGAATLPALWQRHFLDSAQLARWIPAPDATVLDVGSGAGFPGLVLAIIGAGRVTLAESDKRKAAFLREAARLAGTAVAVHAVRVEDWRATPDVITARAVAPLPRLLDQTAHLVGDTTQYLLLKGPDIEDELTAATISWKLQVERHPSLTDPRGVIVQLSQVRRR